MASMEIYLLKEEGSKLSDTEYYEVLLRKETIGTLMKNKRLRPSEKLLKARGKLGLPPHIATTVNFDAVTETLKEEYGELAEQDIEKLHALYFDELEKDVEGDSDSSIDTFDEVNKLKDELETANRQVEELPISIIKEVKYMLSSNGIPAPRTNSGRLWEELKLAIDERDVKMRTIQSEIIDDVYITHIGLPPISNRSMVEYLKELKPFLVDGVIPKAEIEPTVPLKDRDYSFPSVAVENFKNVFEKLQMPEINVEDPLKLEESILGLLESRRLASQKRVDNYLGRAGLPPLHLKSIDEWVKEVKSQMSPPAPVEIAEQPIEVPVSKKEEEPKETVVEAEEDGVESVCLDFASLEFFDRETFKTRIDALRGEKSAAEFLREFIKDMKVVQSDWLKAFRDESLKHVSVKENIFLREDVTLTKDELYNEQFIVTSYNDMDTKDILRKFLLQLTIKHAEAVQE